MKVLGSGSTSASLRTVMLVHDIRNQRVTSAAIGGLGAGMPGLIPRGDLFQRVNCIVVERTPELRASIDSDEEAYFWRVNRVCHVAWGRIADGDEFLER
jgi:hypothetical protein